MCGCFQRSAAFLLLARPGWQAEHRPAGRRSAPWPTPLGGGCGGWLGFPRAGRALFPVPAACAASRRHRGSDGQGAACGPGGLPQSMASSQGRALSPSRTSMGGLPGPGAGLAGRPPAVALLPGSTPESAISRRHLRRVLGHRRHRHIRMAMSRATRRGELGAARHGRNMG